MGSSWCWAASRVHSDPHDDHRARPSWPLQEMQSCVSNDEKRNITFALTLPNAIPLASNNSQSPCRIPLPMNSTPTPTLIISVLAAGLPVAKPLCNPSSDRRTRICSPGHARP